MSKPKFSVVVIARNEAKTLPRLLDSLQEFQVRGGDIVVCDTGSKDGTVAIAKARGCTVVEKSFTHEFTLEDSCKINFAFREDNDAPIVKHGDRIFNFSEARNFAAAHASNDFICQPDCDEIWTAFDIDALNAAIDSGAQRFEYDFVFSHDDQGRPLLQFTHSKCYDRRVFKWVRVVHEVLEGSGKTVVLPPSVIKLEHWQNPSTDRGQYLTGLAWDCFTDPKSDRNSHYFARELFFTGRYKSAIKEFQRHIMMRGWAPERAQSEIYIGQCLEALGESETAKTFYHHAFTTYSKRRTALLRLADLANREKDYAACAAYANASLVIDCQGFYMDDQREYRDLPHRHLYYALCWMGKKFEAQQNWRVALNYEPTCPQLLHDARFFFDLPKVTIIIPTLGREEKLKKCLDLIQANANYPNYEVKVMQDSFGEKNQGAIALLNQGVRESVSPLVMYLSNDCIPEPGFLIQAVLAFLQAGNCPLVALNDGLWNGQLATHWLAPIDLKDSPTLNGEFFESGFHHHGVDNLLTARCKAHGLFVYAPLARVNHVDSNTDEVSRLAWTNVEADRAHLARRLQDLGLEDPCRV